MKLSDSKINYKDAYRDIYELHKKYSKTDTEPEWQGLVTECKTICKKYSNTFVTNVVSEVFEEIERRYNEKR